jgi:glycosyltransferase involved in cell wall biosynthesis
MSQLPTFSVIIPTRDRPAELAACLESLAQQDYPRDRFEVIVVDDAGRLPSAAAVATLGDRLKKLIVVNQSRRSGPSVARNCGAAHATGELLAFTDDDCTPSADWLQKLAARFASTPGHLIGGRVINALTENPYSTASHVILDAVYDYYDPEQGRPHFFPTSNFALAAGKFIEMGGFNEKWPLAAAEDREFCYRWLQRGFRMTHASEAKVYHRHPLTLDGFCRLHFRYGRGAYHYHHLRGGGSGSSSLAPDWAFHWACFRYPFQHSALHRAAPIAALLILWQVSNAAGYFWQRFSSHLAARYLRDREH